MQDAIVVGVRRAAGRRARQHGRLQAAGAGPWRRRLRGAAGRGRERHPAAASAQPGLVGLFSQLPRHAAAALRRRRPHEGEGARRVARRRLRHAAGLPRLGVRERLHPLRPQLAGERAGRRGVPRTTGGHRQLSRCATRDGEMVPLATLLSRARHHRSRHREPLQHVPVRRGRPAAPRRASARGRRSRSWRRSPSASCRRAWASSGPS